MKKSQKSLQRLRKQVDKKLLKEGFFDDIKRGFDRQKSKQGVESNEYRQKKLESERLSYVRKGRPIPAHLTKDALRSYYTNPNSIPDFLQGEENDPLPERSYTTGRKASDVEDRIKEKSADFIGNALGLHPDAKEGLEGAMKVASVTGIASAAATAYNWIKSTFGDEKARQALPQIEAAAEASAVSPRSSASSPSTVPGIKPLSSIVDVLAGIPSNKEFAYVYIPNLGKYFNKIYPSRSGEAIDESKIQAMIDGPVSDLIFGASRNKINPTIKKKIPWSGIYQNIKNDKVNDKSGLGYLSGHYYVSRAKGGTYALKPLSMLSLHFPNLDITDLE